MGKNKKQKQYYRMRVKFHKPYYKSLYIYALVCEDTRAKATTKLKIELDKIAEEEELSYDITKTENLRASIVI